MALDDIKFANRRHHRAPIKNPAFKPGAQVLRTNLSVTPTGASIAVRPPRAAIRRMTGAGQGVVGYV